MLSIKSLFNAATHLFYPHFCAGCGSDLLGEKDLLCLQCIHELPYTSFETYPNNPIERIFTGRLKIISATAGFYFTKGELMQALIHEFKYKGNKDLGIYLSKLLADKLMNSKRFNDIDYLIPLPLFADKEYKRGFNQAKIMCDGIAESMNIPILDKNLIRIHFTETQTKKHRTERWENVADSFKIQQPDLLIDKHVLLVDDVITTGATLEAAAQQIKNIKGINISIATLATAGK